MKTILIGIAIIIAYFTQAFAQAGFDLILKSVETNNTHLAAVRKLADAQKIGNKAGIALQNPEFEFGYLWGKPAITGNRIDISVSQNFDFPSAYAYRNQISNLKNDQAELEFQKQRKTLRYHATLSCIQIVFANIKGNEYAKRLKQAKSLADSYKAMLDAGEGNILDYNKAQLNLLNIQKEVQVNEVIRKSLLDELIRLNGGINIQLNDTLFVQPGLPADFEQWFAKAEQQNPLLQWLKQEIAVSENNVKLNRAMSLPTFSAGYLSEMNAGTEFHGLNFGITIPLWENKNTVRHAKYQTLAVQSAHDDEKFQFYNLLKSLHATAVSLQQNLAAYRQTLQLISNTTLLKKALDKGDMSLISYLMELSFYYDSYDKAIEAERDLQLTISELNRYSL